MAQQSAVKTRLDFSDEMQRLIDDATSKKLGEYIKEQVQEFVSVGTSPVAGVGRFEGYKDEKKYPGKLKPRRPVNLKLTGEMLDALDVKLVSSNRITFGILSDAPNDVKIRAEANNSGTEVNGKEAIPARPFIPDKPGQEFNQTIQRGIKDILSARISDIIKSSK